MRPGKRPNWLRDYQRKRERNARIRRAVGFVAAILLAALLSWVAVRWFGGEWQT